MIPPAAHRGILTPAQVGEMMKKAISLVMAAGLALAGVPAGAQGLPDSITGTVPGGLEGVANAVLLDASGKTLSMVPVTEGKFTFRNVAPGEYSVGLYSASGQRIAKSCALTLASGATRETSFDCPAPAGAPPAEAPPAAAPPTTPTAAATGGGIGTTAWVLIGAAAVGITTAVVIATNEDEGVASAIR
jgi:hypothetical protein